MAYYAIFTTLGLTRLAEAQASYEPLVFTHVAVGDGSGAEIIPAAAMTALVNETARVAVNAVDITTDEPTTVRVEGLLPADVGGFTIREAGLFNAAGEMIAVASYPPIYKPLPAEGVTVEEYIRVLLVYEAVEAIALTTDPHVIIATRIYVDTVTDSLLARGNLGDGADGDADLDGTNTYPWCSKVGDVYTMTRIPALASLIVRSGVTLEGANLPILSLVEIINDGIIECDGGDGGDAVADTGGAGGMAVAAGLFLGGADGGAGGSNSVGTAGTAIAASVGGSGGKGGDSFNAGGAAGAASAPGASRGFTRSMRVLLEGYLLGNNAGTAILTGVTGGAGGGGGGAGGSPGFEGGGGGGAGAGTVAIGCTRLVNNGIIRAKGGDGGDAAEPTSPFTRAGGGGGGGRVGIVCKTMTGDGTITAPGGTRGVGLVVGDSTDAANGVDGSVCVIEFADAALYQRGDHVEEGKAIFADVDSVDVIFPDDWAYQNATGVDGYTLRLHAPYVADYGGVSVWIESKTVTGFTIKASAPFTGEVDWETEGV